jgi:hypothetical protein
MAKEAIARPIKSGSLSQAGAGPSTSVWLAPEDAARFSAFRVVLGAALLADVIHLYLHRSIFSSLQKLQWPIGPMLVPWSIVLVCMIAGYGTRIATIANYICCVFILGIAAGKEGFSQVAGDSIAISLSLLAVILPCGAVFAVDRMGVTDSPQSSVAAARWVLAGYLSSIYVDSGIHKLMSPMWFSGLGLATSMSLPSLVWMNMAWTHLFPALLFRIFGWGVIAFELLFPFFYIWRRTRVLIVLLGIAMHIGIALVYPFPIFSALMIAICMGLLPDSYYGPLRQLDKWIATRFGRPWFNDHVGNFRLPLSSSLAVAAVVIWGLCIGVRYAPADTSYQPARFILNHRLWRVKKLVFATTGVQSHGVFSDGLFLDYRYQLRLIPVNFASGAVPYSRNGLFDWSVRDRVWEIWWKRAQAPWTPLHDAEFQLATWADVYWHPGAEVVTVRIEGRPQHVELHTIEPALFSRNNAVAWRTIGTIRLNHGAAPVITWAYPPRRGEELLGNFLSRVLTHDQQ